MLGAGDLGPVYGFQWRHFGAKYGTMKDDYNGKGIDQLNECIRLIKEDPDSRRIMLTAWNPSGWWLGTKAIIFYFGNPRVCTGGFSIQITMSSFF